MLYRISTTAVFCYLKIFHKLEIKGKENIPRKQPFILASNHISNLDPPTLASSCREKVAFVAKKELFKNKLCSFYLKDVGAIPLKREKADIKIMRTLLNTLKKRALLIFPQGTRRADFDNINPGVGFLAKKSGVPVVAARIYGTDVVLPKGASKFNKGKIKVIFARVDNIEDKDTYEEITTKVVDKIKSL